MKKLKEIVINYSLIIFLAFGIKMVLTEPSLADGLVTLVFSALYGYTQHLKRFQPYNLDAEVAKDLIEVKTALSRMNMIQTTENLKDKKYF